MASLKEFESAINDAIDPVADWFYSDEHSDRPETLFLIREIVKTLQADRMSLLQANNENARLTAALVELQNRVLLLKSEIIRIDDSGNAGFEPGKDY